MKRSTFIDRLGSRLASKVRRRNLSYYDGELAETICRFWPWSHHKFPWAMWRCPYNRGRLFYLMWRYLTEPRRAARRARDGVAVKIVSPLNWGKQSPSPGPLGRERVADARAK